MDGTEKNEPQKSVEKKKTDKKKDTKADKEFVKNTVEINPELEEQKKGSAVISFGRLNPITIGHEKMVNKLKSVAKAKGATPLLFMSHSQDKKKNPLSYNDKYDLARRAFGSIVQKSKAKTIIQVMQELQNKYSDVTLVVGSDRVKEFESLLQKYNGKDYEFDNIDVVSAGERDPDADDVSGMSASKMRALAAAGKEDEFKKGLPRKLQSMADEIYDMVRAGMQLAEELEAEGLLIEAPLTIAQRRKRGRIMKRYARKIAAARRRKSRRKATQDVIQQRARRKAIGVVRQKIAGKKGKLYRELSPAEKSAIDRKVQKRQRQIERLAKRLIPKVRKTERERFAGRRINEEFEYLFESKGFKGTVYHGSGSRFNKFDQRKARVANDFYGGGVAYFTDNLKVAITYAKSMAKKTGGDPIIYTCNLNMKKVFDVDDKFTGKDLINILPTNVEEFARGAGLLGLNSDKFKVIADLKSGKMTLTGDQIFKGLSKGMNQTAKARDHLIKNGYDGLRYNGGVNMGMATKHNVYLSYEAKDIDIVKRQIVRKKSKSVNEEFEALFEDYYKGVPQDKKDDRRRHFEKHSKMDDDNPAAYKPAPGDKDAKTKESKHTKKFKQMYGEEIEEACERDTKPRKRFHELFKKNGAVKHDKRFKMYRKKMDEQTSPEIDRLKDQHKAEKNRLRSSHERELDRAKIRAVRSNVSRSNRMKEEIELENDVDLLNLVDEIYESIELEESNTQAALQKKAEKTGISYGILKKVYDRGVAAWRTGHRPGTTPAQWGMARVNSFATKSKGTWGKADKDLAAKVRKEEVDINSLFEQYIDEGVNDPAIFKAVFLAGGPGSGKSFIVGQTALTALGFKLINSDNAFERALAKANLEATPENIYSPKGQELRKGAKALTGKQLELALEGRLGLVIDGTGKDYAKIEKQANRLRDLGYEVAMIFVNTDQDTALKRNQMRSRSLPDDEVKSMWNEVQKNLGKFQRFFRNKMFIVDNSEGSDFESDVMSVYKKLMTWSKSKPESSAAREWIKAQRGVNEEKGPCWSGYKQVGTKKKNGKEVPNCVPEEHGAGEWGTDKLAKRYRKDTPGQKKVNEAFEALFGDEE